MEDDEDDDDCDDDDGGDDDDDDDDDDDEDDGDGDVDCVDNLVKANGECFFCRFPEVGCIFPSAPIFQGSVRSEKEDKERG